MYKFMIFLDRNNEAFQNFPSTNFNYIKLLTRAVLLNPGKHVQLYYFHLFGLFSIGCAAKLFKQIVCRELKKVEKH